MTLTQAQIQFLNDVRSTLSDSTFGLSKFGFECEDEATYFSEATGTTYEFTLRAPQSVVQVDIHVRPPNGKFSNSCGITISHPARTSFLLETFLQHHGIAYDDQKFDFRTYDGTTQQRFSAFMEYATRVMAEYMAHILSGEQWEEIPQDWHGLK